MDDSGVWGGVIAGKVDSKLANDIVAQFGDAAHARQRFSHAIFGGCSAVPDWASSASALAQLVTPITMANAGIPNTTQDQIDHVRCALADASSCAAIGRAPNLAAAWECPLPADSQQQVCSFALHAHRLNAMPDELQLVWFDARDVDDPSFALFVAGGKAASSQMCTATPRAVSQPPSYYARGFAAVGYGL